MGSRPSKHGHEQNGFLDGTQSEKHYFGRESTGTSGYSSMSKKTFDSASIDESRQDEHGHGHNGFEDGTQSEKLYFGRESTGTSGYSSMSKKTFETAIVDETRQDEHGHEHNGFEEGYSYDFMSPPNSYTGKRLPSEFKTFVKNGLYKDDQRKILNKFRFLIGEIDVDSLMDCFDKYNHFTVFDREDIMCSKPRYKQVIVFLLKLLRLTPAAYGDFLKCLRDKNVGYHYVSIALEEPIFILALNHESVTATAAKERLTRCKDIFLTELEPDETSYIFLEYEEFSVDEFEKIMTAETRRDKSSRIYKRLIEPRHLLRGYLVLVQALKETNRQYLLSKIQDESEGNQTPIVPRTNDISIKTLKVKVKESKRQTKRLKDSDECKLVIKIKESEEMRQYELDVITELNKVEVITTVNHELILQQECLIAKTEQGSIEITLRACGSNSFRNLFSKGVQIPISDILQMVFLHADIRSHVPARGIEIEATLMALPKEDKKKESYTDLAVKHIEFLVEELDALSFLDALKDNKALTDDDVQTIVEAKPSSRKTRTRAMLQTLLDNNKILPFVDILKKKKTYVWDHVFKPADAHLQVPPNAISKYYNGLADNMTPKSLYERFSTSMFEISDSRSDWSREKHARYILQNVFLLDSKSKLTFVNLLSLYGQIPKEIAPKRTKAGDRKTYREPITGKPILKPMEIYSAEIKLCMKRNTGNNPVAMICERQYNPLTITRSFARRNWRRNTKKTSDGQSSLSSDNTNT